MYTNGLLANRVFLITGGGTGLGRAMAERFLQLGASVAISGRRADVLAQTAAQIDSEGRVFPLVCDVRDIHQVEAMVEEVWTRFGRIDVLVNNAAANFVSPTEDLSHNAFKLIIDTVLTGTVQCSLTLGKRWIAHRQSGVFLNISTGYARTGSSFVVPSACAKAGVETLTKSLAVEWAKYGIRVNAIAPGPIPTEGAFKRLIPVDRLVSAGLERIPMKRFGSPAELADLAVFLTSELSSYITGQVIHMDGGFGLNLAGEFNGLNMLSKEEWKEIKRKVREA